MTHTKRYAFDLLAILTTSKIPKFTCPDLGLAGDATYLDVLSSTMDRSHDAQKEVYF
jgi:hypothetical protein